MLLAGEALPAVSTINHFDGGAWRHYSGARQALYISGRRRLVIARVVGPVVDAVPCKSRGVDDEGYSERGSFYAAAASPAVRRS